MFFLLQSKPRYFAALARLLEARETSEFVQTVVFDMYGDQYDTREERLLLDVFEKILESELEAAQSQGSLLRANTATTQMLSAYAKRGQGLSVLKDVLQEPIQRVVANKQLNLEINPMKVYMQIIQEYETTTGQVSDMNKNVDDATAAAHPKVREIIPGRVKQLLEICEEILQRIVTNVDSVPYGMRWICKTLKRLCTAKFPNSTRAQIGSLLGGYIYLRFFNPAIVTPDAINFIKTKPTRVARRNLILIAKVLQNLSNGMRFKDKEVYMQECNRFIDERMETIQDYFDRLADVEDLQDQLQIDKYLEHTTMNSITISFNQISLIHKLLLKHTDVVCPRENDSMRSILKRLGDPPPKLTLKQNRTVVLQLIDRREQRLSTAVDAFENHAVNPLHIQARTLLLSVLRLLPSDANGCTTLLEFLNAQKAKALAEQDASLADHISNVISMLRTLADMGMLKKLDTEDATFDKFLWETAAAALSRRDRLALVKKRRGMIAEAAKTIKDHHEYLQSKLDYYKQYLQNVKVGRAQSNQAGAGDKRKGSKKKKTTVKYAHKELVDMGVIMHTDPSIDSSILKRCYYVFSQAAPDKFEITLHLKKGFDIKLLKKPIQLDLEELLSLQERNQTKLSIDYVDLNVNLIIHILNTKFIYK
eukprot:TRINITY_DN64153_c0_g3_i3.p1 TRINITY_DN64153_c0_g3~~TRINITY_DN64153_c0_g3_i3.p1  ORF type:complete len:649 (-),score=387.13 TRINITY_DN64153_c0_g3_i3:60-2006(-)